MVSVLKYLTSNTRHHLNHCKKIISVISIALLLCSCNDSSNSPDDMQAEKIEHLSAGDASINLKSKDAFSHASRNMVDTDRITGFNSGNHFFENPWVEGTASTQARDGLGPYFNSRACQNCHINDGRGHAPEALLDGVDEGTDFFSMLIRVSRENISDNERATILASQIANVPDSNVGGQLQHQSVAGVQKEANLAVSYTPKTITFNDDHEITLRVPKWIISSNIGDFDDDAVFSARVSPPMIGLGLLELIDENDILIREDSEDSDGDGISGKANIVYTAEFETTMLGRFGWKAGQPSLLEQTSGAFMGDMGLTSKFHTEENCHNAQQDCLDAPNGNGDATKDDDYEVTDSILELVSFYSHHLAVPQRRDAYSEQVQAGKTLFNDAGCIACHVASYTTETSTDHPELSEQIIFPYTDMLLHDMGEDLADFRFDNTKVGSDVLVEFLANAHEWRTPPLWGLGLTKTIDSAATFLHDGRARTIMEAILWHGGEAEAAQQAVLSMNEGARESLLAFLQDL